MNIKINHDRKKQLCGRNVARFAHPHSRGKSRSSRLPESRLRWCSAHSQHWYSAHSHLLKKRWLAARAHSHLLKKRWLSAHAQSFSAYMHSHLLKKRWLSAHAQSFAAHAHSHLLKKRWLTARLLTARWEFFGRHKCLLPAVHNVYEARSQTNTPTKGPSKVSQTCATLV